MLRIRWMIPFAFLFVLVCCNRSDKRQTQNSSPVQQTSSPSVGQQDIVSNSPQPSVTVAETKAKTDACALLTSKEIEAIQGEPLKETKLSGRSEGGFVVSQCFFTLPTFTNSVSLAVTQKGEGAGARDPKEFWSSTFETSSKEGEREREREKGRREEEEKEKERPPKRIGGIGDDAFWTGSRVGGALYVLKGNNYIRVSIGGSGDEASKIRKSKALAQKVIARL